MLLTCYDDNQSPHYIFDKKTMITVLILFLHVRVPNYFNRYITLECECNEYSYSKYKVH